jgi:hypothetical protein
MVDLKAVSFCFPDLAGHKALVLGLGGGCDIITAFALARCLDPDGSRGLVYANTKTGNVGPVQRITPHVVRVTGPVIDLGQRVRGYGSGKIDHSIPRGPEGSPWIVLLTGDVTEHALAAEVRSLGFDMVIGVDTGGDSIAYKGGKGHRGRDQRMLRVLRQTGLSLLHVVVAPGSDGESSWDDLRTVFQQHAAEGRYLGCFALEPLLPALRSLSASLSPTRTPCIILAAAEGRLEQKPGGRLVVPGGKQPAVPDYWLTAAFVFTPAPCAAPQ